MDLGNDLFRFADLDAHFFVGYVIAWLQGHLELQQLEALVDELNEVLRVDGRRVPPPLRPEK